MAAESDPRMTVCPSMEPTTQVISTRRYVTSLAKLHSLPAWIERRHGRDSLVSGLMRFGLPSQIVGPAGFQRICRQRVCGYSGHAVTSVSTGLETLEGGLCRLFGRFGSYGLRALRRTKTGTPRPAGNRQTGRRHPSQYQDSSRRSSTRHGIDLSHGIDDGTRQQRIDVHGLLLYWPRPSSVSHHAIGWMAPL